MLDFLVGLGAIAAIISALPALGVDVRIWGRGKNMPITPLNIPKWRWWLTTIIASLALMGAGYSLYQRYEHSGDSVEEWDKQPKIPVVGKTFSRDRVVLDGKSFTKCTFDNVTLVYNGTAPFDFADNTLIPTVNVMSDRPEIQLSFSFVKEMERMEQEFEKRRDGGVNPQKP